MNGISAAEEETVKFEACLGIAAAAVSAVNGAVHIFRQEMETAPAAELWSDVEDVWMEKNPE